MDRRSAGLRLKRLLEQHESAEALALAALHEDAPADETFAAIEVASEIRIDGLTLRVRRRRHIESCPVPGCRFATLRQACPFSNVRFELYDAVTGGTATGSGLMWHLLAEHPQEPNFAANEEPLLELLAGFDQTANHG